MCDRYAGAEAAAARLQCPVSCILGDVDQMTPTRSGQALAAGQKFGNLEHGQNKK